MIIGLSFVHTIHTIILPIIYFFVNGSSIITAFDYCVFNQILYTLQCLQTYNRDTCEPKICAVLSLNFHLLRLKDRYLRRSERWAAVTVDKKSLQRILSSAEVGCALPVDKIRHFSGPLPPLPPPPLPPPSLNGCVTYLSQADSRWWESVEGGKVGDIIEVGKLFAFGNWEEVRHDAYSWLEI